MKSMNWKRIIAMALLAALALPIRLAAQALEESADSAAQISPCERHHQSVTDCCEHPNASYV